ncbi:MAG: hypothetical protein ACD_50C00181G0002 [uncultured bacterium]|nr:MAG: hypothetical protein ACD_50C00181G0002 [uncultured bacterium]
MPEQKQTQQKPLDQDRISLWIGVTIILLAGIGFVAYVLFTSANPEASLTLFKF